MPKLGPGASKQSKRERMHTEMKKFSEGKLHSGSKTGPVVTSRSQAQAIGLSESGQSRKATRKGYRKSGRGGR